MPPVALSLIHLTQTLLLLPQEPLLTVLNLPHLFLALPFQPLLPLIHLPHLLLLDPRLRLGSTRIGPYECCRGEQEETSQHLRRQFHFWFPHNRAFRHERYVSASPEDPSTPAISTLVPLSQITLNFSNYLRKVEKERVQKQLSQRRDSYLNG